MIDRHRLLSDLQRLLPKLEADIRSRIADHQDLDSALRAEHRNARDANRTSEAYEMWRDGEITQAAVAWVLACVFVRFMEDNGLLDSPHISGPGERRQQAIDRHALYFQGHPTHSDRDYLYEVFEKVAELPAARELFDRRHNPLWRIGLSGDGATALLDFWQRINPDTGHLDHDFADPDWNTRFLGDLYQDLSEAARKKYALLQTPEFVEEFILDRTLTPAIEEFGFREVRMIDPTCGSGHFLLGAFARLFDLWAKNEPGAGARDLAQRVLNQVYGVDVNPYAVAIARFRLLTAVLKACDVHRLADAPGFQLNLAVGDSLLHGKRFRDPDRGTQQSLMPEADPLRHVYDTEDADALKRILGQQYHAVVGNPPYITVRDKTLNEAYRHRYASCHGKFSLVAPFVERLVELALRCSERTSAGFVGVIVANSFMKREFGKTLIERILRNLDLRCLVDSSGAYIPGHGTPTALLFGCNQRPISDIVRTLYSIRGEPETPTEPSQGKVWNAILRFIDSPGSGDDFVSCADVRREEYATHPWSLSGGGIAVAVKSALDRRASRPLGALSSSIGFASFPGLDDAFVLDIATANRLHLPSSFAKSFVFGEAVRDWNVASELIGLAPYDANLQLSRYGVETRWGRHLWRLRTSLEGVVSFGGKTRKMLGESWWGWYRWVPAKYATPLSITGLRGFVWVRFWGISSNRPALQWRQHHREHLEPQVLFVA